MVLVRWNDPFRDLETMRRQMDRLFDEMIRRDEEPPVNRGVDWIPAVELKDTPEALILKVEIPGVEKENLDVSVTRSAVQIAGEHRFENQDEAKGAVRTELRYGRFQRVIALPVPVAHDQSQADYRNGILVLTLPKAAEVKTQVFKPTLTEVAN
ncbi:small heat shock protein (HSP20) family protein [Gloeomargarita lithophora Alchichica-D10]|uniref:Small heat shock protein (HSP20) family protein n=1 Tax=Gloeomargarita lithophora Alchichica-D10 TaxID=1188229 RepID=A0A1J0ADY8_9CYAN|nr:Hsp20/alpha crystallin family protein [Gloeomargarita lithophora]APB34128.1 small heat shock protein (HSP20) family protein [Gloeomargarita lithophora Alchichica-D10]